MDNNQDYQQQPYQQQQQPYQQQPYQQEGYYQPNYAQDQQPPMKPDNHLVWAILCTLFCCLPFGIVSIVYSSKVDGLYSARDYVGAQQAADNAKKWAMWGAICGGIVLVIYIIAIIAGVASSSY